MCGEKQLKVEKLWELCSLGVSSRLKGPLWFAVISPPHRITSSPGLASRLTHSLTHTQHAIRSWHTHTPTTLKANHPKKKRIRRSISISTRPRNYRCNRKQSGSQQCIEHGRQATFEGKELKPKSCACRQEEGSEVLTTFSVNWTKLNSCSLDATSYSDNSWSTGARWQQLTVLCLAGLSLLQQHSYYWIFVVRGTPHVGGALKSGFIGSDDFRDITEELVNPILQNKRLF